jgi:hypothetical protein
MKYPFMNVTVVDAGKSASVIWANVVVAVL